MEKSGLPLKQEVFLEAGVHIGTKIRTSDMREFIFKRRDDGLYILDLRKSAERLVAAAKLLARYKPEEITVVASRVYSSNPANKFAALTGVNLIKGRFVPGTMTNMTCKGFMEPKIILVCDPKGEREAVSESAKNGVPVISLCDTDNETKFIDVVVPINNKGKRSLALIFYILARELLLAQGRIKSYDEFTYDISYFEQMAPVEPKKEEVAPPEGGQPQETAAPRSRLRARQVQRPRKRRFSQPLLLSAGSVRGVRVQAALPGVRLRRVAAQRRVVVQLRRLGVALVLPLVAAHACALRPVDRRGRVERRVVRGPVALQDAFIAVGTLCQRVGYGLARGRIAELLRELQNAGEFVRGRELVYLPASGQVVGEKRIVGVAVPQAVEVQPVPFAHGQVGRLGCEQREAVQGVEAVRGYLVTRGIVARVGGIKLVAVVLLRREREVRAHVRALYGRNARGQDDGALYAAAGGEVAGGDAVIQQAPGIGIALRRVVFPKRVAQQLVGSIGTGVHRTAAGGAVAAQVAERQVP